MLIHFNTDTMRLEEEPMEPGYASEQVNVRSLEGKEHTLGGQQGRTQLIVSLPFIDESIKTELNTLSYTLHNSPLIDATASIVVANFNEKSFEGIEGFEIVCDDQDEFGSYYGTRLANGPLEGELTKALFIITKDGALYYDDIVSNVMDAFNANTAMSKLAAAQECYTGKGCH